MPELGLQQKLVSCSDWPNKFLPEQWVIYRRVISAIRERGISFAIGGGLAAMTYAAQWRNTKDLDIYVLGRDKERLVQLLTELALEDYYPVQAYDRKWIHRFHSGDVIVDVMWAMANQRAQVDESWFEGPEVEAGGERFRLLAPADVIWSKLYVLQHERCDWPDCLNVLYGVGPEIDWRRLLHNLGADVPLLGGLLSVFSWLAPQRARELPSSLWHKLQLSPPDAKVNVNGIETRAGFLDTRPWFSPLLNGSKSSC